jgi:predicted nucleic acid-binding protein
MNSSQKKQEIHNFLFELDTLIAYSSIKDRLHGEVSDVLDTIQRNNFGKVEFYIADSALLEYTLLLRSKQVKETEILETLLAWENFPNFNTVPLDSRSIIRSAGLRDQYTISFFDSLHAATGLTNNLTIVGTDTAYEQIDDLHTLDFKSFYTKLMKWQ